MTENASSPAVRVRFAPSPTGYLHVGGARTALFNWLYARHTGGKFLLRIEDTDLERSTEESVQQIFVSLDWLGLQPDEPAEFQTRRSTLHRQYLDRLVATGAAYKCYCSPERLDALREQCKREKRPFVYDKLCLRDAEHTKTQVAAGVPPVLRFNVPGDGVTVLDDLVYGRIEFENKLIGDFVIARSDGTPTYNFTNAVDDIDMRITHICRGEDHVSNTPKQMMIYHALGAPVPRFAHLPLILGQDKTRLSKRHGATSVMQFKEQGILPESLVNFLALLGWAPEGGTDEVMPLEELVARFSLEKVNKSAAVFDYEKLLWMNGVYLRQMPRERIYGRLIPELTEKFGTHISQPGRDDAWLKSIIDLEVERSRTWNDFATNLEYFFIPPMTFEEKAVKKHLSSPEQIEQLRKTAAELDAGLQDVASLPREEAQTKLDERLRKYSEGLGVKFGNIVHPIRLALTGKTASPGLFDVIYCLGREETIRRIHAAAERFAAK